MSESTNNDGSKRDIYETLGRLDERSEAQGVQLSEIFNQLRRLPCNTHEFRIGALEAGRKPPSGETKPRTGPGYAAITKADLDNTQRLAVERAEEAAEETIDRTLETRIRALEERRSEQRRGVIKSWRELAKIAVAIAATA